MESLNTRIRIPGTQEGKGRIRTILDETLERKSTKNNEKRRECLRRNNEGSRKTADRENIQATNQESMYIQIQQQYGLTPEINRKETEVNLPTPEKKSPRIRKSHTSKKMATHQENAENSKQENRSPPGGGLRGH